MSSRKRAEVKKRLEALRERVAEAAARAALHGADATYETAAELWELARLIFGDMGLPPQRVDTCLKELDDEQLKAEKRLEAATQKRTAQEPPPAPWSWRACLTIALLFALLGLAVDRFLPDVEMGWQEWIALFLAAAALGVNATRLAWLMRRCWRYLRWTPERLAARCQLLRPRFRMERLKKRASRWMGRRSRGEEWVRRQDEALKSEFAHWKALGLRTQPEPGLRDLEVMA